MSINMCVFSSGKKAFDNSCKLSRRVDDCTIGFVIGKEITVYCNVNTVQYIMHKPILKCIVINIIAAI